MMRSVLVHVRRIMRTWLRGPGFWVMTVAAPLVYLFIVNALFGSLVRTLAGSFELSSAVVLVISSWAFILGITGTATVFSERQAGLYERFATLPAPYFAALIARAVAEFLRTVLMMVVVIVVSALVTASSVTADWWWRIAVTGVMVALASATLGTLIAFSVTSPQGAVALVPLIVVAMFVNTVLMPADHYYPALRWLARITPVSAAGDAVNGSSASGLLVCAAWFVGITAVSVAGLVVRARQVGKR